MILNQFSCDGECDEIITIWLSVDLLIAGWSFTEDGKAYCPEHKKVFTPNITNPEIITNTVVELQRHLFKL